MILTLKTEKLGMPPQGGQCIFCQLINNPDQLLLVGETDNFYAWLEVNPRARGQTQIVPKEHIESLMELDSSMWNEVMGLVREVMEKATEGLGADGVSIAMNINEAAGQMQPHAYISVFPRFEGEETAGTPTGAIFPQQEELQQELDSIQNNMESVSFSFEGETHEPHPESQKFKDEDEIDGLLTGGMGSNSSDSSEENDEREEKTDSENETPDIDEEEVEIDQMSDREVLQMLIHRHGSAKNFLESDVLKGLMEDNDMRLVETRSRSRRSSYDWR